MEITLFFCSEKIADELGVKSSYLRTFVIFSLAIIPFVYRKAYRDAVGVSYLITRAGIGILKDGKPDKNLILKWNQVDSASSRGSKFILQSRSGGPLKKIKIPMMLERQELLFAMLVSVLAKHIPSPETVRIRTLPVLSSLALALFSLAFGIACLLGTPDEIGRWILFGGMTTIALVFFWNGFCTVFLSLRTYTNDILLASITKTQRIQYEEIAKINAEITSSNKVPWSQVIIELKNGRKMIMHPLDSIETLLALKPHIERYSIPVEFIDDTEGFFS